VMRTYFIVMCVLCVVCFPGILCGFVWGAVRGRYIVSGNVYVIQLNMV
jgi:hypothetical protein